VAGAGGAAYGCHWARRELGDDALERIGSFYSVALPLIAEYKTLEFWSEVLPAKLPGVFGPPLSQGEMDALFAPLHAKWQSPVRDKFMELGGFYYKSGQRIAGNMGGFVPESWQKAMAPFLDQIPPRPFASVIAPTIEAELGRPISEVWAPARSGAPSPGAEAPPVH